MIQLRDYQLQLRAGIIDAWGGGEQNVCAVLPVGGGKTRIFANILSEQIEPAVAIAHRQELVTQISLALAQCGVKHNIIAPQDVVKNTIRAHLDELGQSFYKCDGLIAVAGVDTLVARSRNLALWAKTVRLWVMDEAHHILAGNKWGKAISMFPNARGLGVTATPERSDGAGLGRHASGVMDCIVEGPSLRDLIGLGWLTDYTIFAPPPSLVLTDRDIGSTGDYKQAALAAASQSQKSRVVGDIVGHYQRLAEGRLGVTFTTDLRTSADIAAAYVAAGVPAEAVDGGTPTPIRADALRRLKRGDLKQLINVDLFGEGFDLPAIGVVDDGRPTCSFARFVQTIGRVLRPQYAPGMPLNTPEQRKAAIAAGPKPRAYYIDHVGNTIRHAVNRGGVIDVCYREWSLDDRARRSAVEPELKLTTCTNVACLLPYPVTKPRCPHCAQKPEPAGRSSPEQVAGDLTELDPAALLTISNTVAKVDGPPRIPGNVDAIVAASIKKKHAARQTAQTKLRSLMQFWSERETQTGKCEAEQMRLFYARYGTDTLSAKGLGAREASELAERIAVDLARGWV